MSDSLHPEIPSINESVLQAMKVLATDPKIQKGLQIAKDQASFAMQEQVELCEIASPTFEEATRAKEIARRMEQYGLTDVSIDEIGNVVGVRKGTGNGPVLVIDAHMDTVFPMGTDVKVRREGDTYYAPGIGDNTSGCRALLQLIRCFNEADIKTEGDILFVGTVGEEGNGDIRGAKFIVKGDRQVDGYIAIDSFSEGVVVNGGVGCHRWRVSIDGKGGHSFMDFSQIPSAIHAMCHAGHLIDHLVPPSEPYTTFNIGTIKGGTSVNTIAPHCEVDIDIRSISNDELLKLEAQIFEALDAGVEEENKRWGITDPEKMLTLTKTQIGDRPAGSRDGGCPIIQCALSAQKVLGIELTQYGPSATDANAPISKNIPAACLGSGGLSEKFHTLDEYFVDRDSYKGPQLVFLAACMLVGVEGQKALLIAKKQ
ncbi:M20/M25/M40 family metallo-hydrolase [Parasutterella secunda]|uniref:M20/M25/M40 family metallo-hydrolase n=1 Tax=Parasutterella secunda TaxID=626947 RepID=A0ABS2GUG8_9BURK|nr:M20/M25/M40 family metallo-hydrolase [Parasutterella secunda]MBM6929091.1 M20/M25/M40 family metallo-hydrolase [Parasutterella secunda]